MRIDIQDPATLELSLTHGCWLNGVPISLITMAADDQEGWVDVVLFGPEGVPLMLPDGAGMLIVRLTGKVELREQNACSLCGLELAFHCAHRPIPHCAGACPGFDDEPVSWPV